MSLEIRKSDFNPFVNQGAVEQYKYDNNSLRKFGIGLITALATIILFGIGGVVVFRALTRRFCPLKPNELPPTAKKTEEVVTKKVTYKWVASPIKIETAPQSEESRYLTKAIQTMQQKLESVTTLHEDTFFRHPDTFFKETETFLESKNVRRDMQEYIEKNPPIIINLFNKVINYPQNDQNPDGISFAEFVTYLIHENLEEELFYSKFSPCVDPRAASFKVTHLLCNITEVRCEILAQMKNIKIYLYDVDLSELNSEPFPLCGFPKLIGNKEADKQMRLVSAFVTTQYKDKQLITFIQPEIVPEFNPAKSDSKRVDDLLSKME